MIIDLSLNNADLYEGCAIETVAGRLNLVTPMAEAIEIVGANVAKMVFDATDRRSVMLTGPMAVWAYMVVFHAVVHAFREVSYNDGRNPTVVIARHG
jgi:hypothetical protein